jgi:hypothetical protein
MNTQKDIFIQEKNLCKGFLCIYDNKIWIFKHVNVIPINCLITIDFVTRHAQSYFILFIHIMYTILLQWWNDILHV